MSHFRKKSEDRRERGSVIAARRKVKPCVVAAVKGPYANDSNQPEATSPRSAPERSLLIADKHPITVTDSKIAARSRAAL
ncbi:hypothetical protein [Paracidovorax wautersii]|uniref:hypothetical protein n=1 Tax=Paracidovorax wautersii TaxID=1177982 RepID=UPI0031DD4E8C